MCLFAALVLSIAVFVTVKKSRMAKCRTSHSG